MYVLICYIMCTCGSWLLYVLVGGVHQEVDYYDFCLSLYVVLLSVCCLHIFLNMLNLGWVHCWPEYSIHVVIDMIFQVGDGYSPLSQ